MVDSKGIELLLNRGYRYALSLTHNKDDAYDLVYSSYLMLFEKGKPIVIAYFLKTIKNNFINEKRHQEAQTKWQQNSNQPNFYKPKVTSEPFLEQLLAELPHRDREIIFLAIVEEYTAQEIANLTNIPQGTVLSILRRTKKKLQLRLQE